jgi:hypothetical protein
MDKLKKVLSFIFQLLKRFFNWTKLQTEFKIAIGALIAWFGFYLGAGTFGIETYPIGYFQKIFFGILATSIIFGVGFFWLKNSQPYYFDLIDPDTQGGVNDLTTWQKVKIGLFWYGLYVSSIVLLASLY